ncbi:MAG TPA: AIR synthase, partial [Acetivibrio sp.]|nr:AIR synthase [Acetivibrio sp.]
MMITCKNGSKLVEKLNSNGIKATIIGKVTGDGERKLVCGDKVLYIGESSTDELYKTRIDSY